MRHSRLAETVTMAHAGHGHQSMEARVEVVEQRGLLVNQVLIPDPRPELFEKLS